ncbi:MAG TPA: LLM class flavin-dependent oxidoreductase [Candidatus Limnocylindrales bacterium]|nr:LLM class flavin-dependent oxidoreductase [Candidatus Limnocylindrales bacterium]
MRFAIDIAPIGELADPRAVVRLATAAEAAGWDGLSVWDNVGNDMDEPVGDPFVILAAVAARTRQLRLILSALVLPRRRPHLVAQSCATLDRLSDGRLVIGAAIGGDPPEFEAFDEPSDLATRARKLDESLDLVDRYLRGERVDHAGPEFVVRSAAVGPEPIQQPRPPIWVGAARSRALRRAARWDGWIGVGISFDGSISMRVSPVEVRASLAVISAERERLGRAGAPFDVALLGYSDPGREPRPRDYEAAGVGWWLESFHPGREPFESLLARASAGPPT